MKGKIIQIAVMNEDKKSHAVLWALTDQGEIYFLVLGEKEWMRQDLPKASVKTQTVE